jgi:hypothetical protein
METDKPRRALERGGALLVGLVGSVFNLGLLSLAAREQPLLMVPGLAGIWGVILVARWPGAGVALTLTGCLPGLWVLSTGIAHGPWGVIYVLPFMIPTMLMGWGAWKTARTVDGPDTSITVTELAFRCGRCGLRFVPYPNAWNNGGFCSRKCLIHAR